MNELIGMNCQKCSEPFNSSRFLCEMELSLQSRAHFVDLILKQWSEALSFFPVLCDQLPDDDVVDI